MHLSSTEPRASGEQVKSALELINLGDSAFVSHYGDDAIDSEANTKILRHLEESPISKLATLMQSILVATQGEAIRSKKRSGLWESFDRVIEIFGGRSLEQQVSSHVSKVSLGSNLEYAAKHVSELEDFLGVASSLETSLVDSAYKIDAYVQAGRQFLAENPEAGKPGVGELAFINTRDRFDRRLTNLATLYVSHLMSVAQLRLAKAQATDILDRYREMRDVLLPVYRQHQLSSANKAFLNPEMSALAVQAHESIQRTVAASLRGLPVDSAPKS